MNIQNNLINETCTCFILIDSKMTLISNNTCFTNKFIKSINATIVNSPGSDLFVHIYDNIFNKIQTH